MIKQVSYDEEAGGICSARVDDVVEIYVWEKLGDKSVGHVAIKFSGDYVSFWPGNVSNRMLSLFLYHDCVFHSYEDDLNAEGRPETRKHTIAGLNTDKMAEAFSYLKLEAIRWYLLGGKGLFETKFNCCSLSLYLLEAGGLKINSLGYKSEFPFGPLEFVKRLCGIHLVLFIVWVCVMIGHTPLFLAACIGSLNCDEILSMDEVRMPITFWSCFFAFLSVFATALMSILYIADKCVIMPLSKIKRFSEGDDLIHRPRGVERILDDALNESGGKRVSIPENRYLLHKKKEPDKDQEEALIRRRFSTQSVF